MKTVTAVTLCCTWGFFGSSNSIKPRSDTERCPLVFAASATAIKSVACHQPMKSSVTVSTETPSGIPAWDPWPRACKPWPLVATCVVWNYSLWPSQQRWICTLLRLSQAQILITVIARRTQFWLQKVALNTILSDSSYFLGAGLLSFPHL